MARMFPSEFPRRFEDDRARSAEKLVYNLLRDRLPDPYVVIYDKSWLTRDARKGQADFVILHPELVCLTLEVKGGRVSYDAAQGCWSSKDRDDVIHEFKRDPFDQAQSTMYFLRDKLRERPGWEKLDLPSGYAVAFPGSRVAQMALRPDAPREVVLDLEDLEKPLDAIERAMRFWLQRQRPLGRDPLKAILDILAPKVDLPAPLRIYIRQDEEKIIRLTEEQYGLLDFLDQYARAVVIGCAGSGKTMIAIEKARRLVAEGMRVLLTFFNRPLGLFLRESLRPVSESAPGRLEVGHYHLLCREHGVPIEFRETARFAAGGPDTADQKLTETFRRRLESEPTDRKFDAVLVDEAQDFSEDWLLALEYALRDSGKGIYYLSWDPTQDFYNRNPVSFMKGFYTYPLTENIRNPRPVFDEWLPLYGGVPKPRALGPTGMAVEHRTFASDDDLERELKAILQRLLQQERVTAGQIAVLGRSAVVENLQNRLGQPLMRADDAVENAAGRYHIILDTIKRFKGLERPVVIVLEPDYDDTADQTCTRYVGYSRPNSHLIVLKRAGR